MTEFRLFIASHGYEPPSDIPVGKTFRFGESKHLWGKLFDDCAGGIFGDWRTGEEYIWQSSDKSKVNKPFIKASQAATQSNMAKEYAEAAKLAEERFYAAGEADASHPYLIAKGIKAHGLRQSGDKLLVPVYSVSGDMQSIQSIDPVGNKRFMTGGKIAFGCHMIGIMQPDSPIVICEGYATGASLLEDGCDCVVIAFTASSLIKVATELKRQLPDQEIMIAGDDDWMTPGNPGKTAAIEAAKAVGGIAVFPPFGENRLPSETDWNDYLRDKNE
jgi:putative DNA primase/helicase